MAKYWTVAKPSIVIVVTIPNASEMTVERTDYISVPQYGDNTSA